MLVLAHAGPAELVLALHADHMATAAVLLHHDATVRTWRRNQ